MRLSLFFIIAGMVFAVLGWLIDILKMEGPFLNSWMFFVVGIILIAVSGIFYKVETPTRKV